MQSKGSSHRLSTMANRSRIPALFISMFATFASIYVAGRFFFFLLLFTSFQSIIAFVFCVNLNFPSSGYGKMHRIAFISSKSSTGSLARSVTSFFYFNFNYCFIVRFSLLLINYYHFRMNHCFWMKLGISIFVVYVIAYEFEFEFDLIFLYVFLNLITIWSHANFYQGLTLWLVLRW